MKRLTKLIAATAVAFAIGAPASSENLRVGMECTYAPFNYRTDSGELEGYDVDVAKGVAEIIGAELEFVCQQWDGMIPALLANKFDLIVASMSITNSRLEKIDFSSPYRDSVGRLVGKSGSEQNLFDPSGNPIPENFAGLRIGLERASTYESWFNARLPDADVVLYDGSEPLYLDLVNGRVDAIMTNPMKAHLRFLTKEEGSGFEFISPAISEVEFFGIGVGIGLRQGQPELKARLDAAIKQLINDGKLTEYALKYFPFPIHNEEWGDG
ncbi:transporter substrate-binding domain-containing protein [Roseovarius aestuarii]|uniref:Lysine-arginine-ornithine-binding periplasmic protein n=1 Tax=Roseovarius aestuarii TaxID=475083 RepID=A0A1X7BX66_9RHOB|nr:transporter substrate-binding domain-containing protein [Roseovarius aestuarii]SMC14095.1 Lysine-arginine-ornithine-binding periplasmic protein precursor [Roseovarius aestuarii]